MGRQRYVSASGSLSELTPFSLHQFLTGIGDCRFLRTSNTLTVERDISSAINGNPCDRELALIQALGNIASEPLEYLERYVELKLVRNLD